MPILRSLFTSGISPNTRYPDRNEPLEAITETWEPISISHTKDVSQSPIISPWRGILSRFILYLTFRDKGAVPALLWDDLQVWLEFGAEIPLEVLIVGRSMKTNSSYIRGASGFQYPNEKPMAYVETFSLGAGRTLSEPGQRYLQTFRSTTMSSLIRWHNPPNATVLLKHTDPVSILAKDAQQWSPPPLVVESRVGYDPRSCRHNPENWLYECQYEWMVLYYRDDIKVWRPEFEIDDASRAIRRKIVARR